LGSEASISEEQLVRATADTALALSITTLSSTVDGNTAAIASEAATRATEDSALAVLIDEVAVEVGDVSAGGLAKFEVSAAPTGVEASYQISLRATAGGDSYLTGMRFDLIDLGGGDFESRVAFLTDQFVITDGSDDHELLFEAGTLFLNSARIHNLTADNIQTKSIDADEILLDGTLITDLIADEAVTIADSALTDGSINNANGAEQTLQTLVFTPDEGFVLIRCSCFAFVSGSASTRDCTFRIKRDGVTVREVTHEIDDIPITTIVMDYQDTTPGTSAVTWTFHADLAGSSGAVVAWNYRAIVAQNSKR
jgi:hypothetical protein